jgi:hypothetical protein
LGKESYAGNWCNLSEVASVQGVRRKTRQVGKVTLVRLLHAFEFSSHRRQNQIVWFTPQLGFYQTLTKPGVQQNFPACRKQEHMVKVLSFHESVYSFFFVSAIEAKPHRPAACSPLLTFFGLRIEERKKERWKNLD